MAQLICGSFKTLLKSFKDSRYPSFGPQIRLLNLTGIWTPVKSSLAKFKLLYFHSMIAFLFTQYFKCCRDGKADGLQLILRFTPYHMGVVKGCFFRKDYVLWEELISYASSLERTQLNEEDSRFGKIVKEYIRRILTFITIYYSMCYIADFLIFSEPYLKNEIVENGTSVYFYLFDGYTPFAKEPPGYYASMAIQTIVGFYMSTLVLGWDGLVVALMAFFAGQLRILRTIYCKDLIEENNTARSRQKIAELHHRYITLIKYQRMCNSLVSPVMFVYVVITSVNLGISIIQIVAMQDHLGAFLSNCLYMLCCMLQLLFFYWHSNEVRVQSLLACYGIFEGQWIGCDLKLQKELIMLGFVTQKSLIFNAGPFSEMSLSTFGAILRASYSYYTLLK